MASEMAQGYRMAPFTQLRSYDERYMAAPPGLVSHDDYQRAFNETSPGFGLSRGGLYREGEDGTKKRLEREVEEEWDKHSEEGESVYEEEGEEKEDTVRGIYRSLGQTAQLARNYQMFVPQQATIETVSLFSLASASSTTSNNNRRAGDQRRRESRGDQRWSSSGSTEAQQQRESACGVYESDERQPGHDACASELEALPVSSWSSTGAASPGVGSALGAVAGPNTTATTSTHSGRRYIGLERKPVGAGSGSTTVVKRGCEPGERGEEQQQQQQQQQMKSEGRHYAAGEEDDDREEEKGNAQRQLACASQGCGDDMSEGLEQRRRRKAEAETEAEAESCKRKTETEKEKENTGDSEANVNTRRCADEKPERERRRECTAMGGQGQSGSSGQGSATAAATATATAAATAGISRATSVVSVRYGTKRKAVATGRSRRRSTSRSKSRGSSSSKRRINRVDGQRAEGRARDREKKNGRGMMIPRKPVGGGSLMG